MNENVRDKERKKMANTSSKQKKNGNSNEEQIKSVPLKANILTDSSQPSLPTPLPQKKNVTLDEEMRQTKENEYI